MTHAQILANKLDGMEYRSRDIADNDHYAKEHNLIVLSGYSDDNIEINGAFSDEVSAYNGVEFSMNEYEVLTECESACDHCDQEYIMNAAPIKVTAEWNVGDYSWFIDAKGVGVKEIHYFNVMEDKTKYCRGVVIRL